jgi:diguanylate cyclase (GGDEF)-like protein
VGTLCLIDYQPREFSDEDQHCLGDLAALAEKEFGAERISRLHIRLLEEIGQLQSQALVDHLTRLWNRRAVLEILEMERSRALRKDYKVGLILADLDHFKDINDRYGHPAGDAVLAETALRIRSCLRASDAAGRYGGEEFMIVLPEVGREMAMKIAERIRLSIQKEPFPTPQGSVRATLSLGVGILSPDTESPLESLVSKVDQALYQAKTEGRNRSCFFPEDPLTLFK